MARDIGGENSGVPARRRNLSLTTASACWVLSPETRKKIGAQAHWSTSRNPLAVFPESALHLALEIMHDKRM